jgi:diguanylate cyclase (GGDEF)-like protein
VGTPLFIVGVGAAMVLGFIVPTFAGDVTPLQAYWLVLPATIAGIRFGVVGALSTSALCWLVSSPFVAELVQEPKPGYGTWLGEAAFLGIVSLTVAVLVGRLKRADRQMFSLVTKQREQALDAARVEGVLSQELQKRASEDPLTGLANRSAFLARLQDELRANPDSTAVLFLDLDDFKRVNDTLGHAVGDELIIAVGERLTSGSRDRDLVARFGGDEFAVLLSRVNADDALQPAQRFLGELKAPFNLCGRTVVVRASGGLAVSQGITNVGVEQRALDLLKHADLAMYTSKLERGSAVTLFHEQMQREMLDRLAMESDMHRALADDQFFLVYQPVVETRSGLVRAVEALLRWDHPESGAIGPQDFIPVAEQTGMIVPLTLWVVRHAAMQIRRWDEDPRTEGLAVALNISGRLVVEPGIGAAIARELHNVGINPNRIIFEITESVLMEERSVAVQTLCQLRALGTRLSVDDFGTGYSSLSRLNTLPIDEVKIDRSFIHGLDSQAGRTIVRASIAMAHGLGLRVVAEGVETERQLRALRETGCDDVQGYLISRPIAPEAVADTITAAHMQAEAVGGGLPLQPDRTDALAL